MTSIFKRGVSSFISIGIDNFLLFNDYKDEELSHAKKEQFIALGFKKNESFM